MAGLTSCARAAQESVIIIRKKLSDKELYESHLDLLAGSSLLGSMASFPLLYLLDKSNRSAKPTT